MSAGELVDVLVMVVVVVVGTERVREAHQPPQGASELRVRMLENPAVHGRPGCGGAEVKTQRAAVWLNMQSESGGEEGGSGGKPGRAGGRAAVRPAAAAAEQLCEVPHVHGPAEMSSLQLRASQLIRTPPSARGTNKKR